jgi:uncharacterized protein
MIPNDFRLGLWDSSKLLHQTHIIDNTFCLNNFAILKAQENHSFPTNFLARGMYEADRPIQITLVRSRRLKIKQLATQASPKRKLDVVKEDPDDNIILECALEAHADIIVSADRDLLRLKQFEGIQIHHPSNLKYIFSYLAGDD